MHKHKQPCALRSYAENIAYCGPPYPRFPGLQRQLAASVLGFIRAGAEPAERMIASLIECEHDFINCDHPEFIGGRGAIRAVMHDRALRATQGRAKVGGFGEGRGIVGNKEGRRSVCMHTSVCATLCTPMDAAEHTWPCVRQWMPQSIPGHVYTLSAALTHAWVRAGPHAHKLSGQNENTETFKT